MSITAQNIPLVNSWTEWGQLEHVMVGSAENMCYPDEEWIPLNRPRSDDMKSYVKLYTGIRPQARILKAQEAEPSADF
ncbi:unnamed protein product [Adineta ricciae]|uniref:Uncharacterized protein n=1 Tax=Adineta ricciae TaxID=249248 RepID=A0A816HMC6_ADIRI|nr:unnamed protein product [Adineta ricciae]